MRRMRAVSVFTRAMIAALIASLSAGRTWAGPLGIPQAITAVGAGPKLLVVVVPLDAPAQAAQGLLEVTAVEAVQRADRFELMPEIEVLDPAAAAARGVNVATAAARVKDGQKDLDDLETGKATAAFQDAIKALKQTDTRQTFDALVKAWVMKAASHAIAGEAPLSKQEIERVIAIAPKAEFAAQFFPPELIKFVEAQRKMAGNAKGELLVRTEPTGAPVWVNGQYRGLSPVTVKGLLGARHQVVAALGGRALAITELPPGESTIELKPAELQPLYGKAVATIGKAPTGAARDQALSGLGKKLGADQVLAVLVKKSTAGERFELTLLRLEVRDGHNSGYATATLPLAEPTAALATAFDGVLVKDSPRNGRAPVTHFDGEAEGGGASTRQIVGVSLLVGAAGLLATGIGTSVAAQDRYRLFRETPQVKVLIAQSLASESLTLSVVSLVSFIAAAAAGAIGAVFTFLKPGPAAEPSSDKPAARRPEPTREEPTKAAPPPDSSRPARADPPPESTPTSTSTPPRADPKDEKRRKDEEAKRRKDDEQRQRDEAEAKKADADAKRQEGERKKADADAKRQEDERKKADADAKRQEDERKKAEADEKRQKEEEKKRLEAEAKKGGKTSDEVRRQLEAENAAEARRKEEDEKKRREDEEKRKREEEDRKRREEEEKKKQAPKKEEDHDDLRNF